MNESNILLSLAKEEYCYLTTTGRVSGRPHEIEIWFGLRDQTLYLLSGGGTQSDWVKNLRKHPSVSVRVGQYMFAGRARLVREAEEDRAARLLVARKYQEMDDEETPDEWARTALPVAIDLTSVARE
jgi:deazaflavin-dependent oxidoreductase (nitroreductase family)